MRTVLAGVCVSILLFSAACGDSASTGGAPAGGAGGAGAAASGGAPVTGGMGGQGGGGAAASGSVEADYCAPLAAQLCASAATCDCAEVSPSGSFDPAACEASFTAACLEAYGPVVTAVASGDAVVDPARAAACVAAIAAGTPACEAPRGTIPLGLCDAWFFSDAPLGAACDFPICAGGAGYCPAGDCVARPGAGDPCSGYECAPGLLCLDGACAAPGQDGDPCDVDDGCAPPLRCLAGACHALGGPSSACDTAADCALGLDCVGSACTAVDPTPCTDDASCGNQGLCVSLPRCAPLAAQGEGCLSDAHCDVGLYCDAGQCAPLPGDGQPCVNGTFCAPNLGCTTDFGDCAALPGDGQPCAFGPMGPVLCAGDLGCLAGTCGALPGDGEPCTIDNRCADPLGCDFTMSGSFCVAKKPVGGACQNDQVCDVGLHCDFTQGSCAADFAIGASCSVGNECGEVAVCLPDGSGGLACAPTPGLGEVCQFDCEPGLACRVDPAAAVCVAPICAAL